MGDFIEMEDLAQARGFLRVKIMVNTKNPLVAGCWLFRAGDRNIGIEFSFERLQDFWYKYGRIGHSDNECSFEHGGGGVAVYGEWTKANMIRKVQEKPRQRMVQPTKRRHPRMARLT